MKAALVVPFRFGQPARDRAWQWLRTRWRDQHPGLQVYVGSIRDPQTDWCKATAVANALGRAKAEILVVCDADMMIDRAALRHAVQAVEDGRREWAVPYVQVGRLDEPTTGLLYRDGQLPPSPRLERHLYDGIRGGGCVVLRRDVYFDCPLDSRFTLWGGEDEAWGLALTALHGPPQRVTGIAWHLWHPHAAPYRPRERMPELPESGELLKRYRKVRKDPVLMRALVDRRPSTGDRRA